MLTYVIKYYYVIQMLYSQYKMYFKHKPINRFTKYGWLKNELYMCEKLWDYVMSWVKFFHVMCPHLIGVLYAKKW